jgi:hypothetical protein
VAGWRRAWDFNHQPPTRLCLRSLSHPLSTRPSLIRNLESAIKANKIPVEKLRKTISYTLQTLLGHGWFGQHSALHRPWDLTTTTSCSCGAPGFKPESILSSNAYDMTATATLSERSRLLLTHASFSTLGKDRLPCASSLHKTARFSAPHPPSSIRPRFRTLTTHPPYATQCSPTTTSLAARRRFDPPA